MGWVVAALLLGLGGCASPTTGVLMRPDEKVAATPKGETP